MQVSVERAQRGRYDAGSGSYGSAQPRSAHVDVAALQARVVTSQEPPAQQGSPAAPHVRHVPLEHARPVLQLPLPQHGWPVPPHAPHVPPLLHPKPARHASRKPSKSGGAQQRWPDAPHGAHTSATQFELTPQYWQSGPQFDQSAEVSRHVSAPQYVRPGVSQRQLPALQVAVEPHSRPHRPQFWSSVCVSWQR